MTENRSSIGLVQPDPPFWTKTAWLQLGYGIWVNLTIIAIGLAFEWPAVSVPQLMDKDTPINMTSSDEAWVASALTLSSPIGCLLSGYVMDNYGRRMILILCEIPMSIGWLYTAVANSAQHIIIGRIICGIGIGFAMSAPRTYITEITLPNMRGVIGSLPNLALSVGITTQAALGSFLGWDILCFIAFAFTFFLGILNFYLPDSPHYVLMKSSPSKVERTLRKFRSSKFNVRAEVEELMDYKTTNHIRSLPCKEQIKELWKPSTCKPFWIAMFYVILMQLVGVNVVMTWAVEMLQLANSSVNPNLGNFILGINRMVVGVITSMLLYKFGRRPMALLSAIGVGIVCISFGAYLFTKDDVKAVYPQLFFVAYITFATLGYYTLPFLMMFELFPLQVRGILGSISLSIVTFLMFGMNQLYPLLRDHFGMPTCITAFGVNSLIGALVLNFILPETKNLTLQEIEEYYNSTRPTLVSQRQVRSLQLQLSSIQMIYDDKNRSEFKNKKLLDEKHHKSASKLNLVNEASTSKKRNLDTIENNEDSIKSDEEKYEKNASKLNIKDETSTSKKQQENNDNEDSNSTDKKKKK